MKAIDVGISITTVPELIAFKGVMVKLKYESPPTISIVSPYRV